MFKAFKFHLWTNANQERELGIMLETHRRLYNAALAQRQWFYNEWQISRSYSDQSGWFKDERQDNRWFAAINFSSAQATLRRLDKAFANFFRRVKAGEEPGYPRFKSADRFNSVLFPSHGEGIRLKGNKLRVQHVGTIRVCLITGASGGVGSMAVQLAKAKGAFVIATASGKNEEFVRSLGADEFVDYTREKFEESVRQVDVVFDTVGGDTLERS
jgi:putative transposase